MALIVSATPPGKFLIIFVSPEICLANPFLSCEKLTSCIFGDALYSLLLLSRFSLYKMDSSISMQLKSFSFSIFKKCPIIALFNLINNPSLSVTMLFSVEKLKSTQSFLCTGLVLSHSSIKVFRFLVVLCKYSIILFNSSLTTFSLSLFLYVSIVPIILFLVDDSISFFISIKYSINDLQDSWPSLDHHSVDFQDS